MNDIEGVSAELRYVAVPSEAYLPEGLDELGDREVIQGVVDLGHELGVDPGSWRQEPPDIFFTRPPDDAAVRPAAQPGR